MKTLRKEPMWIEFVDKFPLPDEQEKGVVYYRDEIKTGMMVCPCGCGAHIGFGPAWVVRSVDPFTLDGSIQVDGGCGSHFIITKGVANFV